MLVKHHARGKFYLIACPEGSRVVRRSDQVACDGGPLPDLIVVPFEGGEVAIPADSPELLPLLAESGRCGLALVGEPRPDASLAEAACPWCGERDVDWLSAEDDAGRIRCERCGGGFERGGGSIEFGQEAGGVGDGDPRRPRGAG